MSVEHAKTTHFNFFRKLVNFVYQILLLQNKAWAISKGNGLSR